jgi:hypothetical protein
MLSPEDRFAIEQLLARYCACLDLGDARGWAQCFTVDGEFGVRNMHKGRDRLEVHCADVFLRRQANPWANVQHWNGNLVVEGGAGAARALSCLAMLGRVRDTGAMTIVAQGWYHDQLRKIDGHWLFQSRRISFDAPPPDFVSSLA